MDEDEMCVSMVTMPLFNVAEAHLGLPSNSKSSALISRMEKHSAPMWKQLAPPRSPLDDAVSAPVVKMDPWNVHVASR